MTQTGMTDTPKSWNPSSYCTAIESAGHLQVAPFFDRMLLFREVRRSMNNGQYIAYCRSHQPLSR